MVRALVFCDLLLIKCQTYIHTSVQKDGVFQSIVWLSSLKQMNYETLEMNKDLELTLTLQESVTMM